MDFRGAVRIFDGFILRKRSNRKGEIRWLAIGMRNDEVISVVYTERNETCRIIAPRRARRKERAAYRELYAGRA
ncbi:MAG: BrnT family toxin [Methyloceanibacter sp.]|nr:BrnT family toxin [Methyloceanibacter sp.]